MPEEFEVVLVHREAVVVHSPSWTITFGCDMAGPITMTTWKANVPGLAGILQAELASAALKKAIEGWSEEYAL